MWVGITLNIFIGLQPIVTLGMTILEHWQCFKVFTPCCGFYTRRSYYFNLLNECSDVITDILCVSRQNAENLKVRLNVRKFLNFLFVLRSFKSRAMAQAVSRQPLTAEARVRSQVSACGICGGRSGTGTGFSPGTSVFSLSVSFHRCSITRKNEKTDHLHHRVAQ